jgi:hypothetical protein
MSVRPPQLVCALALLLVLAAGARWLRGGEADRAPQPQAGFTGAAFAAEPPTLAPQRFLPWNPPSAQSAGREWIFEVFTPPIIFFDPASRQFTLRPPLEPAPAPLFGIAVDGLERVPYRLRFAGYHGEPGRYHVELREVVAGTFHRGRPGDTFPDLGFTLLRFVAEPRRIADPERPWATPYLDTHIEVEVEDERLGRRVLFGREPLYLPEPAARLRDEVSGETTRRFVGESWETVAGRFLVETVDPASGRVVIAKFAEAAQLPERRTFTLTPEAPALAP